MRSLWANFLEKAILLVTSLLGLSDDSCRKAIKIVDIFLGLLHLSQLLDFSSLEALEVGVEVGSCCSSYDLLFRGLLQVVPNVPRYGFVKEERFLADYSERAAEVVKIVVLDVNSFEQNLSLGWSVESQQ